MLYLVRDKPDGMYGLIKGSVAISVPNDVGSDYVVHNAQPGFWIGDSALFSEQMRLVSVMATKDSQVLFLPRTRLKVLLDDHPELLRDFYQLSHMNQAVSMRLLANMSIQQSDKRLVAWLLYADENLEKKMDWIELSHEKIAPLVAMSLPTLQRLLRRFANRDLIEIGYGRLRVLDRAGLYHAGQE